MALAFEVNLGGAFQVTNPTSAVIIEKADTSGVFPPPGAFPSVTNHIVQTDQPVEIKTTWTVSGALAAIIAGSWKAEVFLEQYGGDEASPGKYSTTVSHVPSMNHTYQVTVNVPANQIKPGLYKLALIVTLQGPTGIPLPVAGFMELGNLHYYAAA